LSALHAVAATSRSPNRSTPEPPRPLPSSVTCVPGRPAIGSTSWTVGLGVGPVSGEFVPHAVTRATHNDNAAMRCFILVPSVGRGRPASAARLPLRALRPRYVPLSARRTAAPPGARSGRRDLHGHALAHLARRGDADDPVGVAGLPAGVDELRLLEQAAHLDPGVAHAARHDPGRAGLPGPPRQAHAALLA